MNENSIPQVIHVVISLEPGGLERMVIDLTNERNRRFPGSTRIVCLDKLGAWAGQVGGGAVFCLKADRRKLPWDRKAARKLREQCLGGGSDYRLQTTDRPAAEKSPVSSHQSPVGFQPSGFRFHPSPLILHSHNLAAWQYAVLAARAGTAKVVYTQHGANPHTSRFRDRLRSAMLKMGTSRIVAVAESVRISMRKSMGILPSGIQIVPNGVRMVEDRGQRTDDRLRVNKCSNARIFESSNSEFVFGSVGRLSHEKGYDRLLTAFAQLVKDSRTRSDSGKLEHQGRKGSEEATAATVAQKTVVSSQLSVVSQSSATPILLLIGDGPERCMLERQALDLGIKDQVRFVGFRESPAELLSVMDLFVLPSRNEGLSLALLEAMAAGVPVAVTDAGDSRRVIEDGACGALLPDDETAWPEILENQMTEDGGREAREKAERAKQRVVEHYSLENSLSAYEKIYGEMTGRQRTDDGGQSAEDGGTAKEGKSERKDSEF